MKLFAKVVYSFQSLAIFGKSSILDIWIGSEYASVLTKQNPVFFCDLRMCILQALELLPTSKMQSFAATFND